MTPAEVRACGITLRETYASQKVADRMMAVFREMTGKSVATKQAGEIRADG